MHCSRREAKGEQDFASPDSGGCVDVGDVSQDPRSEAVAVKSSFIVVKAMDSSVLADLVIVYIEIGSGKTDVIMSMAPSLKYSALVQP